MTALAPGDITSTTVEDALLEILRRIAELQTTQDRNPQNRTIINTFTQNELTGTITVALTIPSSISLSQAGIVVNATEVFT
jgi:hypothetical protein